ncbi:MAG: tetratricopeptide repeat protein [Acidobacteriota bacterium]|nr:tetratricopeptide repeat protein [Acidobacteriota bacterium]MDQ7087637.1 tetratricopeptide repeat protein [Acidobacteriota bacterium]
MRFDGASKILLATVALLALAMAPVMADYDAGLAYFKQGKYVESAAEWEGVIANAPEYAYAYYMLGNCYLKLKKYRDAEPQFRKAADLDPGKFNYHLNLAQTLMALRKYTETINVLDQAEDLATSERQKTLLHRLRGLALVSTKDYSRAAEDLKQANPGGHHQVASNLARACYQINDYDCLKDAATKALKLKATDEATQSLLVRATVERARRTKDKARKKAIYKQAAAYAAKLIPIAKDKVKAHELNGAALLGAEDYKKAIAEFRKGLELKPKSCNAMMNIATAYQQLADWDAVIEWAGKAATCDPKSHAAYGKIAFAYNKKAKNADKSRQEALYGKAIAAADKALAIKAGDKWARQQKQIARKGIEAKRQNDAVDADAQRVAAEKAAAERAAEEERKRLERWKALQGEKKKSGGGS